MAAVLIMPTSHIVKPMPSTLSAFSFMMAGNASERLAGHEAGLHKKEEKESYCLRLASISFLKILSLISSTFSFGIKK
jgi:hypothetical protein